MGLRVLAPFLLGLAVGIAVGLAWRGSEPAARAPRATDEARTSRPDAARSPARADVPAKPRRTGDAVAPAGEGRIVRRDTDAPPWEEARGWLVVDCRGSTVEAGNEMVLGRTMFGETEAVFPAEIEHGVARYLLGPGSFEVSWAEPERGRRRVRVRVAAGETTLVRLADPRQPEEDPVPAGFGRLHVTVFDLGGRRVPDVAVMLHGPGVTGIERGSIRTEASGSGHANVLPGRYRLVIGDQAQQVDVAAARTVPLVFRYVQEGEVEIRCPLGGEFFLTLPGRPHAINPCGYLTDPPLVRLLYVLPGTYDLYLQGLEEEGARFLQPVHVPRLGRTAVVARLPGGTIHVRIHGDGTPPRREIGEPGRLMAQRLDRRTAPHEVKTWVSYAAHAGARRFPGTAKFQYLPPGRWRIRYAPTGFHPIETEVDVGRELAEVSLRLRRKP
ncbi:MAG: hypothetical protein ACYTEZ_10935 [Planctomycetota bacterium]|jgi:hypothetical protein